jgi:hypothetical protein
VGAKMDKLQIRTLPPPKRLPAKGCRALLKIKFARQKFISLSLPASVLKIEAFLYTL